MSIFFRIFLVGAARLFYFYLFLQRGVSAVQGHPRSINVVPIESAGSTSYLAPFPRYDRFYVLLTPPLFNPNFGGVPVAPDRPCWASASTWTLSHSAVKLFSKNSNVFEHVPERYGQTDRRTDRRLTVTLPCSALASRGKN